MAARRFRSHPDVPAQPPTPASQQTKHKLKYYPDNAAAKEVLAVWERGVAIERAKREAAGKAPARQLREEDVRL